MPFPDAPRWTATTPPRPDRSARSCLLSRPPLPGVLSYMYGATASFQTRRCTCWHRAAKFATGPNKRSPYGTKGRDATMGNSQPWSLTNVQGSHTVYQND